MVDLNSTWHIYVPLYSGAGYLSGDVTFQWKNSSDVDGTLNWSMPPRSADPIYPDGFSTQVTMQGCLFTPTKSFATDWLNKTLNFPNNYSDLLSLTKGANQLGTILSFNNQSSWVSLNPNHGTLSGTFFSAYLDPVTGKVTNTPIQGVILQRPGIGGGYFFTGSGYQEFDIY